MSPSDKSLIPLPNGALSLNELTAILQILPVQISFIDTENVFRHFDGQEIYNRDVSMLGTDVFACHSPQTHPNLTAILREFRKGTQNLAKFWHRRENQLVLMSYYAVRKPQGDYLGCLAVYQDIAPLQTIVGEQHTLTWD